MGGYLRSFPEFRQAGYTAVLGTNRLSALVTNDLSGFAVVLFGRKVAVDETDPVVTGDTTDAI